MRNKQKIIFYTICFPIPCRSTVMLLFNNELLPRPGGAAKAESHLEGQPLKLFYHAATPKTMPVSATPKGNPITDPIGANFLRPSVRDCLPDFIITTSRMDVNRFPAHNPSRPARLPLLSHPMQSQYVDFVAIDESHFDEPGGHGGIAEHAGL